MERDPDSVRRQLRITCADALNLLTDFLEEALSPEDRERLREHLEGCEACAAYLDQLRTTVTVVGTIRGAEEYPVDEETVDRLADLFRSYSGRGGEPTGA